ncbi:hypothetical protein C8T65DRAFT_8198 [Cerioporus squamosus]|nr:hypothetical protein C8T65DRAFT_8198 [Cerioporus squamosus]
MWGHLDVRDVGARGGMKREESIPGGARLEDLAHWAGAGCLLDGAYCIAHCGDGDRGLGCSWAERAGKAGRRRDGSKRGERYLYCEGAGRRQMHAVPAHVADQVHLGESHKFTVINPGRGGETVALACMAALCSQMVVLRSPLSSVLPFSVLPASRQQHVSRPPYHQPRFACITLIAQNNAGVRRPALATRLGPRGAGGGRAAASGLGRGAGVAGVVWAALEEDKGGGGSNSPDADLSGHHDAHWRLARRTASANPGSGPPHST